MARHRHRFAYAGAAVLAALTLVLGSAAGSVAGVGSGAGQGSGTGSGGGGTGSRAFIDAYARSIKFTGGGYVPGYGGHNGVVLDLPVCWYESGTTPLELQRLQVIYHHLGEADRDSFPPWPADFHYGDDTGQFYTPDCITDDWQSNPAVNAWMTAHWANFYLWVPKANPLPPEVIKPVVLAQISARIDFLPALTMSTSPDAAQPSFVGLPTWIWSDDPVWTNGMSVTATAGDESVTTTATPFQLTVDPGTTPDRATVDTTGGGDVCTTFAAYDPADPGARPDCGVTYQHSTADLGGPYHIATTVVWRLTWTQTINGVTTDEGLVPGVPNLTSDNAPIAVLVHEVQTAVTSAG